VLAVPRGGPGATGHTGPTGDSGDTGSTGATGTCHLLTLSALFIGNLVKQSTV